LAASLHGSRHRCRDRLTHRCVDGAIGKARLSSGK
jgi:hypothetical protein